MGPPRKLIPRQYEGKGIFFTSRIQVPYSPLASRSDFQALGVGLTPDLRKGQGSGRQEDEGQGTEPPMFLSLGTCCTCTVPS